MRTYVLALLAAFCLPALSGEPDTRTPMEKYQGAVAYTSINCSLVMEAALLTAELERTSGPSGEKNDYRRCIDDGKKAIRTTYASALKTVKSPPARAALKEHYIAALTRVEGIAPQFGETRGNYSRRQADNQSRLDEKWNRYEAE